MQTSKKLTRYQRRRLKATGEELYRVADGDRKFFERRPERRHRMRLSSAVEMEQWNILLGYETVLPPGERMFTAVRHMEDGIRLRTYFSAPADAETDISEAIAKRIFDTAVNPATLAACRRMNGHD